MIGHFIILTNIKFQYKSAEKVFFKSGPPMFLISFIKLGVMDPIHLPIPVITIIFSQASSLITLANSSLSQA
jgi:hypothetical protein